MKKLNRLNITFIGLSIILAFFAFKPAKAVVQTDYTQCNSVISGEILKTRTPWQLLDRQDCLQGKIDELVIQKKEAQTLRDQKRGVVSTTTEVKTEETPITQLNKAMGLK